MRTVKIVGILAFFTLLSCVFVACNEPVDTYGEVTVNLTEENQVFLFNTKLARNKARSNGLGGPVGFIFRLGGNYSYSTNDREDDLGFISPLLTTRALLNGQIDLNDFRSDSLKIDGNHVAFLPECLTEQFIDNGNGSYVYTITFGNDCEVAGEVFRGRLIEEGSYLDDKFAATTTYEDFGTAFWRINGKYTYDGTWQFLHDPSDSLINYWSAIYNYSYRLSEEYFTGDEIVSIDSRGSGDERMDLNGITVFHQESELSYADGQLFTSRVERPLYQNSNCGDEAFIYVQGIETGTYSFEGQNENYTVDYGNGACDNIITVRAGSESVEIDLTEEYKKVSIASGG